MEERGLENQGTIADALPVLKRPEVRELFERQGVLSPVELESRFAAHAEHDILAIEVEAKLALQMARTQVSPAAVRYLGELARALKEQQAMGLQPSLSMPTCWPSSCTGSTMAATRSTPICGTGLSSCCHGCRHCVRPWMARRGWSTTHCGPCPATRRFCSCAERSRPSHWCACQPTPKDVVKVTVCSCHSSHDDVSVCWCAMAAPQTSQPVRHYRLVDRQGAPHPVLDDLYDSLDAAWAEAISWWQQHMGPGQEPVEIGVEVSTASGNWRTLRHPGG